MEIRHKLTWGIPSLYMNMDKWFISGCNLWLSSRLLADFFEIPRDVYVADLVFSNEYHPEAYHIVYGLKQKDIYWIDKSVLRNHVFL